MDKEINQLVELFQSKVKNIKYESNLTIIEFENGQVVPLYGGSGELEIDLPKCDFCGLPPIGPNEMLFTIDGTKHICIKCTVLALETFLKNGADIQLKLDKMFPDLAEQLQEFQKLSKTTKMDSK